MITDEQLKRNLSRNLKKTLDIQGLTPYRLAKMVDEPQTSVYRIVRGENVPNAVLLARMAEALDVTVDSLLQSARKRAAISA